MSEFERSFKTNIVEIMALVSNNIPVLVGFNHLSMPYLLC